MDKLNLKELFSSKKFKVALCGILALICSVLAEKLSVQQAIESAIPIILVYLGAQGLADFGKSAKTIEYKDEGSGK